MQSNNAQQLAARSTQLDQPAIDEQNVVEGLDRVNLTNLRNRFLDINRIRLQRLQHALLPGQRIFLDLLPLLFHINHPALPGYGNAAVPTGIRHFKVSREAVKAARSLSKTFALQRDPNPELQISAIYLMGSSGSLAHNNRSDLDIWICPAGPLDDETQRALQKKCDALTEWASKLCLEAHFFIMHDASFREQQRAAMDKENCGRTQHFLLLDEFYRTAVQLAGSTPLWWFVPQSFDHEYGSYSETLLGKRYISEMACTDFGSAATIPAHEFISAGVWQLYKGIESPHKALLKLLLIEAYAAEPDNANLSAEFKRRVYEGDYQVDELDPYLQVYRRVESYLKANDAPERLELARRCLYFKAGIKLSCAPEDVDATGLLSKRLEQPQHWRRNLMHKLVAEWGWKRAQLIKLDQRDQWQFSEMAAEQQQLIKELVNSYRLLSTLVKQQQVDGNNQFDASALEAHSLELNILGRQLYAAFEQKPHKIARLTAAVAANTAQELITLRQEKNTTGKPIWIAELDAAGQPVREIVKKAESPAEILVWCIANGLANSSTRFNIEPGEHDLTDYEVRQLLTSLANQLPLRRQAANDDAGKERFAKPARVSQCLFIANCGLDPLKVQKDQGLLRVSEKVDPLAFSGVEENLVGSVTLVLINSWQETFCYHFAGADAVNECLVHYFGLASEQRGAANTTLAERTVLCACPSRPGPIANRLASLLDDIEQCYFDNQAVGAPCNERRYVFQSAFGYHVFDWQQQRPAIQLIESTGKLLEHLSNPDNASAVSIDSYALQDHPLSTICRKLEAGTNDAGAESRSSVGNRIRVFYEVDGDFAHTYLTDKNHAICYAHIPYESTRALIMPLRQFIERSSLRHATANPHAAAMGIDTVPCSSQMLTGSAGHMLITGQEIPDIEFFALQKNGTGYSTTQVPTESNISAKYLPIKAVGAQNAAGQIDWVIHCNDELFDQAVLGEQLFSAVAASIKKFRKSDQPAYRCYINDIEVHRSGHASSSLVQDFYYKNLLEDSLNNAFVQLY
ncbi:MAG: class I adenylate cyclase [Pseudomonadales bacterium]|nr:class I adenylate cyclase [Pseudomonadales bacterium]